jgi:hypothetical protein
MGVGLGAQYTPTCHHVTTLDATSSRLNPETLATCEVLAHLHMTFHSCTCGLCRDTAAIAATLIKYSGARSLLGQGRGGGDRGRLVPLHRRTTTLDHYFDSSSAGLHV